MQNQRRNLGALVIGAFVLRWILVATRGDFLEYDETYYLLIARSLREGRGFVMNGLPQIGFPPVPALMLALLDLLFDSMVTPARVSSALFGAFLVIPVYHVGRVWWDKHTAMMGACFVTVCPTLMTFVPLEAPYASLLFFGYEPLGVLIVYGTVWALLGLLRRFTPAKGMVLGTSAGLAYLTRNEWILLAGSMLFLSALAAARVPRADRLRAWWSVLAVVAAFLVVSTPYPLYLHKVTGSWSVTGKTEAAARIRPTVVALVRDNDIMAYDKAHYALDSSGSRMASSYWGFDGARRDGSLSLTLSGIMQNLQLYAGVLLPVLVPWSLWPLMLCGIIRILKHPRYASWLTHASIAVLLIPSLAVCLFLFVEPRHHVYLVPLALLLASGGLLQLRQWLKQDWIVGGVTAAVCAWMLALSLQPLWKLSSQNHLVAEAARMRSMGRVLAEDTSYGGPIMSRHPALAFWAGQEWRVIPSADMPQVAAYALRRGVTKLVIEKDIFGPLFGDEQEVEPPFSIFQLRQLTPQQAEQADYTIYRVESTELYSRYLLLGHKGGGS